MFSSQLIPQLSKLETDVTKLDGSILSLSQTEGRFRHSPSVQIADELERLENAIAEQYHETLDQIQTIFKTIDSLAGNGSPLDELPRVEEVQSLIAQFFKGNHIQYQSGVISMNCGCHAHRMKRPKPGDFVCANYHGSSILMIVLKFVDKECFVYDPTDLSHGINVVKLGLEDWTPLPTIMPEKPMSKCEYSRGSKVLSLWRSDEESEWTTEFYKATVVERPCDRLSNQSRGYLLDFGDDCRDVVPERFVVAVPEGWA